MQLRREHILRVECISGVSPCPAVLSCSSDEFVGLLTAPHRTATLDSTQLALHILIMLNAVQHSVNIITM